MKVKTTSASYLFIMLSCVRLEVLVSIPAIDILYDIIKALGLIVAIIIYIRSQKRIIVLRKVRISAEVAFWGWVGISILSVLVNQTNIIDALIKYMPFVSCFLLIKCVNIRNDFNSFFSVIGAYFSVLAVSSFLTGLLFPQGIIQESHIRNGMLAVETVSVHLLGKANACGPILLGMGVCMIVNVYINNKTSRIRKLICFLPFLNIILMGSSTAILGLGVFALIILFAKIKRTYSKKRGINFYLVLIVVLGLTIGVVLFNIQFYFENLFVLLFNKDITFSNRTYVWKLTVDYIASHFTGLHYIIGNGKTTYSMEMFNGRYAHSHNQLLDIMIQSGIAGLLFYILMFADALKRLVKQYNKYKDFVLIVVGASIVSLLIMFITEVYVASIVLLLLMIAYFSEKWVKQ